MRRQTAFTLIELLVVLSIIALLLSVLLPCLSRARGSAESAVCASNLRQLAVGNGYYANDHDGFYCPGAADFRVTNLHRWHGMREHASEPFDGRFGPLAPYFTADGAIRVCASLRIGLAEDDPRRFEKNCGGYGYNLAFIGRQLEKLDAGFFRLTTDLVGAKNNRIHQPAETVMFADSVFVGENLIEYSFVEPRFFPTFGSRPDPSIHFRHGASANVAWCDGHVDRRGMTFSWTSGLYQSDPESHGVGWFGEYDDNGMFDLD